MKLKNPIHDGLDRLCVFHQEYGSLLPDVLDFDKFVAKSGETGGWHPDDHAVYLQSLGSPSGVSSSDLALAARLFHIHPTEIQAHSRSVAALTIEYWKMQDVLVCHQKSLLVSDLLA